MTRIAPKVVFILIAIISFNSCLLSNDIKTDIGNIHYIAIEGGFWGIITLGGIKLDPTNLENECKVEDLRVRIEYRILEDQTGIHMWGTYIEILNITQLESS